MCLFYGRWSSFSDPCCKLLSLCCILVCLFLADCLLADKKRCGFSVVVTFNLRCVKHFCFLFYWQQILFNCELIVFVVGMIYVRHWNEIMTTNKESSQQKYVSLQVIFDQKLRNILKTYNVNIIFISSKKNTETFESLKLKFKFWNDFESILPQSPSLAKWQSCPQKEGHRPRGLPKSPIFE